MRSILVAGFLATALLAGCTSPSGETAQDAFSVARREAQDRYSDAFLVSAFGLEARVSEDVTGMGMDLDSEEGRLMASLTNATDDVIGDGHAPAWGFVFVSPDSKKVVVLAVVDGKVEYSFEQAFPEDVPTEALDAYRELADAWEIDSVEAMEALRASNATLDAAIAAGNMTSVQYMLDLEDKAWDIEGRAEGHLSFSAEVSIDSAVVSGLKVKLDGGKPIVPKPAKIIPEPIQEQGTFTVSFDPLNLQGGGICNTPTAECFEFPFEILGAPVKVDATLEWMLPSNDLDFYVYEGNTEVLSGASPIGVPTNQEAITGELPAGEYTVIVVGWSAVGETFDLNVQFS